MDHRDFLNRLFPDIPDDTNILIHQLPLKQSNFFKTADDAADFVEGIFNSTNNIYTTWGLVRDGVVS